MPKLLACTFTYAKDLELLGVTLVGNLRAGVDEVVVFVDAKSPFSEEELRTILPEDITGRVHYKLTTFDRRRNLNGEECVRGMHACMQNAAAEREADWFIKLDSDTIITKVFVDDLRTLTKQEPRVVGFVSSSDHLKPWRMYGCSYAFHKDVFMAFNAAMDEWFKQSMAHNKHLCRIYEEDAVMTSICAAGGIVMSQADIVKDGTRGWLTPHNYKGDPKPIPGLRAWSTGNINLDPVLGMLDDAERRFLEVSAARKFIALGL